MKPTALLSTAILFLVGCSSISTSYDADRGASFDNLKTFSWRTAETSAVVATELDPVLEQTIRELTANELRTRGYAAATGGKADFTIDAYTTVVGRKTVAYVDNGFTGGADGYAGTSAFTEVETEYEEGTLVLEIANGATGAHMWRGVAKGVVDRGASAETRRQRLTKAIHQTLAQFPPPQR